MIMIQMIIIQILMMILNDSNSKKCYIYDDDGNKQVISNITSEKACNEYHGSWE